jgi:hypothetical protein
MEAIEKKAFAAIPMSRIRTWDISGSGSNRVDASTSLAVIQHAVMRAMGLHDEAMISARFVVTLLHG